MGGHNSVCIAQETHLALLREAGCADPSQLLVYGDPWPISPTKEACYIDDHCVMRICLKKDLSASSGPDQKLIEQSHQVYSKYKLPRAIDKAHGFAKEREGKPRRGDGAFVLYGTGVSSFKGKAAVAEEKCSAIFRLTTRLLNLPWIDKPLLRRVLALQMFPFMHRRECTSFHDSVYKWMANQKDSGALKIHNAIKSEIF